MQKNKDNSDSQHSSSPEVQKLADRSTNSPLFKLNFTTEMHASNKKKNNQNPWEFLENNDTVLQKGLT